jgi:hemoglobin
MSCATTVSLFERLGGEPAISAAVEIFYERVLADAELRPFFDDSRMERLKKRQKQFFTQALGGPAVYRGANMKSAHRKHSIEQKHFEKTVGHLVGTLKQLKVPAKMIEEVVSLLAPLAGDIINAPRAKQARV